MRMGRSPWQIYDVFEVCLRLSGSGAVSVFQECAQVFDFNGDGDVDLQDFAAFQAAFQAAFTGPR